MCAYSNVLGGILGCVVVFRGYIRLTPPTHAEGDLGGRGRGRGNPILGSHHLHLLKESLGGRYNFPAG